MSATIISGCGEPMLLLVAEAVSWLATRPAMVAPTSNTGKAILENGEFIFIAKRRGGSPSIANNPNVRAGLKPLFAPRAPALRF
jgi:hypothetical protein